MPLIDVARCFKFMEERKDPSIFKIKIYLLNFITLLETNDDIPNLGFSLSNKKILKTGFKFLHRLEESIEEMIIKWSKQNLDLYHLSK